MLLWCIPGIVLCWTCVAVMLGRRSDNFGSWQSLICRRISWFTCPRSSEALSTSPTFDCRWITSNSCLTASVHAYQFLDIPDSQCDLCVFKGTEYLSKGFHVIDKVCQLTDEIGWQYWCIMHVTRPILLLLGLYTQLQTAKMIKLHYFSAFNTIE